MIKSAFLQCNHKIIHRSIENDNFESLIHHFNNSRVADEGKLRYEDCLIHFLTHSGPINESLANLNCLIFAVVTTNELSYEMEIPSLLKNVLQAIDFDPFEQIEDSVLLLDSVISNLGISNFKPETLKAILQMDSYDEKVYNIARANQEAEIKMKRDLIEGVKKVQIQQPIQMPQTVIAQAPQQQFQNQQNLISQQNISRNVKKAPDGNLEMFDKLCKEIESKKTTKRHDNLQFTVIEKLKVKLDKEGKVLKNEIVGELMMYMSNSDLKEAKIFFKTDFDCKFSPNLDKEDGKRGILRAKSSFPIEKSVPLVRWQRTEDFGDFTFSFWETERQDGPNKCNDIIMDYEKNHDISDILFLFNTSGKNLTGNCKTRGNYLIWQSDAQTESIEFTAESSIFPIKVFFHSNRKCQFDIESVETGKKSNEKYDIDYIYMVDSAEIVE
ncbi:Medium subunit of clathrin adaptor complex [Pseudoloma neurophilia]|uniref:Coatomer subunit delta n=1 Tax=Pseudoloma neurophilia TaxID=146866 RepID=A0A0R0M4S7_9MICR|nr:Medium subunit of clathrin adaptor complex [Pseudoloma neurophilia]